MPTLRSFLAKIMNGGSIDADLLGVRGGCEARLIRLSQELAAERQEVERLVLEVRGASLAVDTDGARFDTRVTAAVQSFRPLSEKLERAVAVKEVAQVSQGIIREPEDRDRVEGGLVVGLLTFVEALINAAFFYSAYLTAGPAAAMMASLLISATNMSVSVAGGFFFGRWINYGLDARDAGNPEYARHRRKARWGTGIIAAALLFFHLSVGAVRAQETFDITHGPSEYLEVFTTPESLFLVLLGLVLSMVAWHKGKSAFDDPYPGYGEAGRALQAARDELEAAFEDAVDDLDDDAAAILDEIEAFEEEQTGKVADHREALARYDAKAEDVQRAVTEAENSYRTEAAELRELRQIVPKARRDELLRPDPAMNFSFERQLPGPRPAVLELPDFGPQKAAIHRAKQRAVERLTQAYEQAINNASGGEA